MNDECVCVMQQNGMENKGFQFDTKWHWHENGHYIGLKHSMCCMYDVRMCVYMYCALVCIKGQFQSVHIETHS